MEKAQLLVDYLGINKIELDSEIAEIISPYKRFILGFDSSYILLSS